MEEMKQFVGDKARKFNIFDSVIVMDEFIDYISIVYFCKENLLIYPELLNYLKCFLTKNKKNIDLNKVLMCACNQSYISLELLKFIIDLGVNVNTCTGDSSRYYIRKPLHMILSYSNNLRMTLDCVKMLVENGAKVNELDNGLTALECFLSRVPIRDFEPNTHLYQEIIMYLLSQSCHKDMASINLFNLQVSETEFNVYKICIEEFNSRNIKPAVKPRI